MDQFVPGVEDSTMDPHTAQVLRNMAKRIDELENRIAQLEKELKREKFLELPKDMSLQEQAKALVEHKDTPMTYQELRERFG
jgi:uncharacterized small protein (DUF1192 family)